MTPFIIGEIGQNHNGSVEIAKLLIEMASKPIKEDLFGLELKPMDAVKLTKRDLKEELSYSQMNRLYDNPNSFGKTYGEHRKFLELNNEQHHECYLYAKSLNFEFIETLCAIGCLSLLKLFTPDKLKVASRDLTNLPLINALAETKIPIILSTGMSGKKELDNALEIITKQHNNISILHCVSEYPTQPQNVNLNTINYLKKHYADYTIGFSDHTIGIATPIAAIAMGAEIIEKHITLDRKMKGTDQAGSLGPEGLKRMVRDIRVMEMSMGKEDIFIDPSVSSARKKLERSVASNKELKKGAIITEKDIHLLSPGDGIKWSDKDTLIGKVLNQDIAKNEIIYKNDLK
ncbi:MAG: N-acetylneuraminate synthase family protein [Flavobacteriales bacterium]|nr:N-acetylneuraminate synthase family protein [Flavobacteriales bacterium]